MRTCTHNGGADCYGPVYSEYHTAIDIVGLYWHFVDIIWTFLFTISILPGFH